LTWNFTHKAGISKRVNPIFATSELEVNIWLYVRSMQRPYQFRRNKIESLHGYVRPYYVLSTINRNLLIIKFLYNFWWRGEGLAYIFHQTTQYPGGH
jgi:hypothetical protein